MEICTYCGEPRADKIGCCGENHWDEVEEENNPRGCQDGACGHESDCSIHNTGVPELLGPCDCGAVSATNLELLGLSAKAAGELHLFPYKPEWLESAESWNPLRFNGDALALAVKLSISIGFDGDALLVQGRIHAYNVGDRCAATRRAIVRAAAEIGKSL